MSSHTHAMAGVAGKGGVTTAADRRNRILIYLGLACAIAVAPMFLYPVFVMKVMCFALFACSMNLLAGYAGLTSFGHAAFFGMGSYVSAYAARNWGVTPEISILLGGGIGLLLGVVFGWLAIRRPGMYFAMVTLALAQLVYFVCIQAPFTGGEDGIQQVPRGSLFGFLSLEDNMVLYWVVAAVFLAGFMFVQRVIHSPFGQILKATRENDARAISLGYQTNYYKWMLFTVSAFIAGIAGGTKAIVFGIATLTDVHFAMSGEAVLMTLLGGAGTILGPIAGAGLVISLQNYLAPFGDWVMIVQGSVFVFVVLVFKNGIIGEINARFKTRL